MLGDGDGYDAVVIGSGYGGSVAACRMSKAGIRVCLMEKGRKWEPQDFPTNSFNILSTVRMENRKWGFTFGRKDALIQVYEQDDSLASVACGLGGGSLINAGVMVSTPVRARRNKNWPKEWETDWEVCEASASAMLKAQCPPVEFPNAKVMRRIVEDEIEDCSSSLIKLSINFDPKESSANTIGSQQINSCLACGNCLTGCPYNAKNSTDKNYLAAAVQAGCTIKTECQVQYVVRNLDEGREDESRTSKNMRRRWRVYLNDIDYVLCDFVVVSAGVFGTCEILFKSVRRGLNVSERLGSGFSTNGNTCAYLALSSAPLTSYGLDKSKFSKISFQDRPGPSISSSYTSSLGFTIQSAVLSLAFPYLIFKGISTYAWPSGFWLLHGVIEKLNHMLGLKASHAMALNVMGYDDSNGEITLEKETDRICFTPPHDPLLPQKIRALQKLTKRLGGILFMSRTRSTSVHLLGGCNAASDHSCGVCDPNGQVFYPSNPKHVHPGLYICDASLVPCSIGVNPCLTVASVAEHVSRYLVQDVLKYKSTTCLAQLPIRKPEAMLSNRQCSTTMIRETMRGYIGGMPCTAYLTMKMNSGGKSILDEQSPTIGDPYPFLRGAVGGYLIFKFMEKDKLYITDGKVDMCKVDERTPYTQYMHYHLTLVSTSGSRYILEGKKVMNPYLLFSYAWRESRTLHITFRRVGKQSPNEPKIDLTGELRLSFIDLLRSLISLKGNAKGKFLSLLIRSLFRTYITQTPRGSHQYFSPLDAIEKSYPPSTHHEIKTEDGVIISCRQWKCKQNSWKNEEEKHSPVLLINGYSTESYWLPTEPNDLVRTLLEGGHEIWLLQARLHPLHPLNDFTIEDIAKFDIPAAIKLIIELHAPSTKVHVVAHCVGGLSIHIALMGGHISATRIASLSCTNSSMFFKLTTSSIVKMTLPLIPISMSILGKEKILPMFQNTKCSFPHRLLKSIARLIPRYERCIHDECEVFSGIFGNTFWHENVRRSMHYWLNKQSLPNLPMSGFPHLRKICTTGFIVDPDGNNKYLIHPERMAVDTLYISGGRSLLVTPYTSFLANQYMKLHQPGYKHRRVVVDGFGHSDLLIGEESYKKVFPHIMSHIRSVEGGNGGEGSEESKYNYKKESLSWSWDADPCEGSMCGLVGWIGAFQGFVLFLLFVIVIILL